MNRGKRAISPEIAAPSIRRRRVVPPEEQNEGDIRHQQMANFVSHFRIDYNLLSRYLRDTGAIIAGSSVLQIFLGESFEDSDLDIYVPIQYINLWKSNLLQLGFEERSVYYSTPYRQSFLFQNGIKQVMTFKHPDIENDKKHIQLMSVRKKTYPREVVGTFDLSFCKCWYDGANFYALDPLGISQKTGYLAENYAQKLIDGSWIMTKRVTKYHNRGFTIKVPENFHTQVNVKELMELGQQAYMRNFQSGDFELNGFRLGKFSRQYYEKYYEELTTKVFSTPETMNQWLNKFLFHFSLGIEPKMSMEKRYGRGRLYIYDRVPPRGGSLLHEIKFKGMTENSEHYDSDDEEDFANVTHNVNINDVAYYTQFLYMEPLRIALREIHQITPDSIIDYDSSYTTFLIRSFHRENSFLRSQGQSSRYTVVNLDSLFRSYKFRKSMMQQHHTIKMFKEELLSQGLLDEGMEILFNIFGGTGGLEELDKASEEEDEVTQFVGKTTDIFPVICHPDFTKDEEIRISIPEPKIPNIDTPLFNSIRMKDT